MDWQGKTKEQIEYSNKVVALSVMGLILLLVVSVFI